jgi:hypothetical protein
MDTLIEIGLEIEWLKQAAVNSTARFTLLPPCNFQAFKK